MITDYLLELQGQLRLPPRRRRRILAEVEDHLLCAAADLHAAGLEAIDAESKAVEQFGSSALLAQSFIEQEAALVGTRAAETTGALAILLAILVLGPLSSVVPWARFVFPGSLVNFVLGQVALVAGALALVRAWSAAPTGGPRGARLRFLLRSGTVVVCCAGATTATAMITVTSGRSSWTPIGWTALGCLMFGVAASSVRLFRCRRVAIVAAVGPTDNERAADALADLQALASVAVTSLSRRVPALRQPLRALVELAHALTAAISERAPRVGSWLDLRGHPRRFALSVSTAAGLAIAATHAVLEGISPHHVVGALLGAAVIVAIETLAALTGFALLGEFLGIRTRGARS